MFSTSLLENSSLAETFPSGSVTVSFIRPPCPFLYHPARLNPRDRTTATQTVASAAASTRVSHKGLMPSESFTMVLVGGWWWGPNDRVRAGYDVGDGMERRGVSNGDRVLIQNKQGRDIASDKGGSHSTHGLEDKVG
jgi:hypothetical protein